MAQDLGLRAWGLGLGARGFAEFHELMEGTSRVNSGGRSSTSSSAPSPAMAHGLYLGLICLRCRVKSPGAAGRGRWGGGMLGDSKGGRLQGQSLGDSGCFGFRTLVLYGLWFWVEGLGRLGVKVSGFKA